MDMSKALDKYLRGLTKLTDQALGVYGEALGGEPVSKETLQAAKDVLTLMGGIVKGGRSEKAETEQKQSEADIGVSEILSRFGSTVEGGKRSLFTGTFREGE